MCGLSSPVPTNQNGETEQEYSLLKEMFERFCPTLKLVAFYFIVMDLFPLIFLFYGDPFLHQNIS